MLELNVLAQRLLNIVMINQPKQVLLSQLLMLLSLLRQLPKKVLPMLSQLPKQVLPLKIS